MRLLTLNSYINPPSNESKQRRRNAASRFYDYRLIYERLQALVLLREADDMVGLVNLLRAGLVRNLGNITAAGLFGRALAGTKLLIEDYVAHVAAAVAHVARHPTAPAPERSRLTGQARLDVLHDTRQAFGRSALLLQGGAAFGLCHLGVVRALHLRGLLPRIVVGSATGALVAALVGARSDEELLPFLDGDRLDLGAFAADKPDANAGAGALKTLQRRVGRFVKYGYFLDARILEECVRANVGDMTFEEAYARTRRVLNITVSTTADEVGAAPGLLNYITAPNVVCLLLSLMHACYTDRRSKLIWSAAAASNAGAGSLYSPVTLLCKTNDGTIRPWSSRPSSSAGTATPSNSMSTGTAQVPAANGIGLAQLPSSAHATARDTPTSRVCELFNVNHFVVSQARPSIAPFLQAAAGAGSARRAMRKGAARRSALWDPLRRVIVLEVQHRVRQLAALRLLPASLADVLLDETLPGDSVTVVPELRAGDFASLLERPTGERVAMWVRRGERSVWPAVAALRVRCAIELELDAAYQAVRRRKPMDAVPMGTGLGGGNGWEEGDGDADEEETETFAPAEEEVRRGETRRRKRAKSGF